MPSLENQEWGLKYFCGANSHHMHVLRRRPGPTCSHQLKELHVHVGLAALPFFLFIGLRVFM